MMRYNNIFVVLTYINSEDLIDFLESTKKIVDDYKVIVVNSYYDEKSKDKIRKIAKRYDCDFLNVDNKGYSYGNNRGIEYAIRNYDFQYLTISNADIVINRYDTSDLPTKGIFAGVLIAKNGRNQNPMMVKENNLSEKLIYQSFVNGTKWKFILGVGLKKISREIFLAIHRKMTKVCGNNEKHHEIVRIYEPHGSFITFSKEAIKKLWKENVGIFDENIFLFAEESILAARAKKEKVPIYFSDFAICHHKEDGSMKLSKIDMSGELAKSNIYFYENYCK